MKSDDKKTIKTLIINKYWDIHSKAKIPNACQTDSLPDDVAQIRNRILSIAKEILGLSEHRVPVENK